MKSYNRVVKNCLHGQAMPDDLAKLWEAVEEEPWSDFVAFSLVEKTDKKYFEGYNESDGVPPESVAAYRKMFGHIAFVGKREDGELVGYWMGPENRKIADSPIVELDTEGQFRLRGRNLAEYLLCCVFSEEDYTRLRKCLGKLGLKVKAKTQNELLESFDDFDGDFGDPNALSGRYQQGLEALPPSKLRFGNFKFPKATEMLEQLGIRNITARSKIDEVIAQAGKPAETGERSHVVGLGYLDAWIFYKFDDCQLNVQFGETKNVTGVVLMGPGTFD